MDPLMRRDVSLAPFTTIGLGGPARLYAACSTVPQLCEALTYAERTGIPVQVFAGGSNIVFADEGFDGLVICVGLRGIRADRDGDAFLVTGAAGESWDPLVAMATGKGWGGIECLSGIPGTIGATPIQNVGAYGQEVAETIVGVRALDRKSQQVVDFRPDECGFAYRQSRFKGTDADRFIVTEVRFRLRPDARADLRYGELKSAVDETVDLAVLHPGTETLTAIRGAVIGLRRKKSMVIDPANGNSRSVGSFFTNPVLADAEYRRIEGEWKNAGRTTPVPGFPFPGGVKVPAAWLVDNAGYARGFSRGGVAVSDNHALALVNRGGTTRELLALAEEIQRAVVQKFGVRLEREPVIIPFRP